MELYKKSEKFLDKIMKELGHIKYFEIEKPLIDFKKKSNLIELDSKFIERFDKEKKFPRNLKLYGNGYEYYIEIKDDYGADFPYYTIYEFNKCPIGNSLQIIKAINDIRYKIYASECKEVVKCKYCKEKIHWTKIEGDIIQKAKAYLNNHCGNCNKLLYIENMILKEFATGEYERISSDEIKYYYLKEMDLEYIYNNVSLINILNDEETEVEVIFKNGERKRYRNGKEIKTDK